MIRLPVFIVALLAVAISADALDAGCGGGSSVGLFGRGGGIFARFRARRESRQAAYAQAAYGYSRPVAFTYAPAAFAVPMVVPQAVSGCPCNLAPADAPMATPQKTSALAKPAYRVILTTRAPTGQHTHSHATEDGEIHAWDHKANSGHVCNVPVVRNGKIEPCGVHQNVQDAQKHRVTVAHVVRVDAPEVANAPVSQAAPVRTVQTYAPSSVIYRAATGGCANGQCSTISRSFR